MQNGCYKRGNYRLFRKHLLDDGKAERTVESYLLNASKNLLSQTYCHPSALSMLSSSRNFTIGYAQDFVKYGMVPELMGRLPVIASLDDLDQSMLLRILQEPKNALIKQYEELMRMDGVTLRFEAEALESIADKALEQGMGARGLRSIVEGIIGLNVRASYKV